jgi:hypothetical protein
LKHGDDKWELRLHRNSGTHLHANLGKMSGLVPNTTLPSKASTCHGNNEVDNQL